MKYIVHKQLGLICFQSHIQHAAMANWLGGKENIESAGSFYHYVEGIKIADGSMTLQMNKKEEDSFLIEHAMRD